ncbi:MAG TPA: T9SS type A sorting domain-containing protein [Aequorivita sp.]|nr:T9SS type A sorting domain-containing protein [Aequorivita sp.]
MKNIVQTLIFLASIYSFCQDGQLDTSFNPTVNLNNEVRAIAEQADGKILIGGWFTENGSYSIHRLNQDGSLDAGFDYPPGFIGGINAIVVQPDNKIIVGGGYPGFLKRLNENGSLDPTFDARIQEDDVISSIKLLADNNILVSGVFTQINSTHIQSFAKLSPLGSVDYTFDLNLQSDTYIDDFEVQADGKIIIAGVHDPNPGPQRIILSRYNPDGSLDPSFMAAQQTIGNYIYDIEIDQNDKILVSGPFTKIGSVTRYNLARLNGDGSLDTSFDSYNLPENGTTYTIFGIRALEDGKYFINGTFNIYNDRNSFSIAKINNDGTIDPSFNMGTGPNEYVWSSCIQNDGKIVIGGDFTAYDGTSINRIARLGNTLSIIENPFAEGIRVYPNPFKDVINIAGLDNSPISVSIYSLTGQLIKTETLNHLKTIDTQALASGMYLARIGNGEYSKSVKLVKE